MAEEIFIEKGGLQRSHWIDLLKKVATRFAIITDDHVKDLYGTALKKRFEAELFSIPPGEKSKTRQWKEILEDQMIEKGLGRDTAIVALGGGVVTDLAGFIAATYCRGISFISIPTTLLGMVDASIGGKVGVNTPHAKNWIGAFYHPRFLFIDPDLISTLPAKERQNGMAEIIKYALIASPTLFEKLVKKKPSDEDLIRESCSIKTRIVTEDPQERGLRRILNFGHTIGHAIETVSSYRVSHGQAIAIGMVAEARLSYKMGTLCEKEFFMIMELFETYGFSLQLPKEIEEGQLIKTMRLDKKALSQMPRFVMLEKIGKTMAFEDAYCSHVESGLLQETIEWMFSYANA